MTATAPRVIARGEWVLLREKTLEDARQDYEWRRDPELAAYDASQPIGMTYRAFLATAAEELRHPSSYRRSYAIEDRATGRHIGNVMYYGHDTALGQAELGITIGERDYWAHGYGTDAVRLLVGFLFEELELARVYLHTLQSNARAQGAFARAGFRLVRPVRRDGYAFHLMEIGRREYEATRSERADG